MIGALGCWLALRQKRRGNQSSGGGGGGGGKKSMRLGRVGARGRRYPITTTRSNRSVIIKAKYNKSNEAANSRIRGWIAYCTKEKTRDDERELSPENRNKNSHELREKEFFSAHREGIPPKEAIELLINNKGEKIAMHTLILSPGDRAVDLREYARDQMSALEDYLGHKLTWVGNIHRDTGPDKAHINVSIAGHIPDFEQVIKEREDRLLSSAIPKGYKLDLNRIADQDKLQGKDGQTYSKYDSLDRLKGFDEFCRETGDNRIPQADYKLLWHWIGAKEKHGEQAFGKAPLKEIELEIDLSQITKQEQLRVQGLTYTKFNSKSELEGLLKWSNKDESRQFNSNDAEMLTSWIKAKDEHGEAVFGAPPLREKEEKLQEVRKAISIDLSRVPEEERINPLGRTYTKYDNISTLSGLRNWLQTSNESAISEDKRTMLDEWIERKTDLGEDAFGKPPVKEYLIDKTYHIDLRKISPADKVVLGKEVWTKYSSPDQLTQLMDRLEGDHSQNESINDARSKVGKWLNDKESYGERFEGPPPLKEVPIRYQELDLSKISPHQKVSLGEQTYTKYHQSEVLKEALAELEQKRAEPGAHEQSNEDISKLKLWIHLKDRFGEQVVGQPPLKKYQIDYAQIPQGERIWHTNHPFTKYDSLEDLERLSRDLEGKDGRNQDQEHQLNGWIEVKRELGDDAFGDPPLKSLPPRNLEINPELIKDPTDRAAAELLQGRMFSVQAVVLDRALNRYDDMRKREERQSELRSLANERGDVHLDKQAFALMRQRGNDFVYAAKSLDDTIDRTIESELGDRDNDHSREQAKGRERQEPFMLNRSTGEDQAAQVARVSLDSMLQSTQMKAQNDIERNGESERDRESEM